MKPKLYYWLIIICILPIPALPQRSYTIISYNVENLFDTLDDTLKADEEFLPGGPRGWNDYKYYKKLNHIAKTLIAAGEWSAPAIVGLCEIENKRTLTDLLFNTPLAALNYQIIHFESPDIRGIDVAIIFRKDLLQLLNTHPIPVHLTDTSARPTRDILYAQFRLPTYDTLYLFLNHWPSMWGGAATTRPKRMQAAKTLKHSMDTLIQSQSKAKIICMGDFNCTPQSPEISEGLGARLMQDTLINSCFYALNYRFRKHIKGTHKFHNQWSSIDQVIVNGNLLNCNRMHVPRSCQIFCPDFLLIKDDTYGGYKPFRTFYGFEYQGGFSDHLPLVVKVHMF